MAMQSSLSVKSKSFDVFLLSILANSGVKFQSSSVVCTPQVTNDLRREPFPTSMDVYYWWIPEPQNVTRLSEPAILTTSWRQENT